MTRKLLVAAWMIVCIAMVGSVLNAGAQGRWKDDGNGGCQFDATDSGPEQCTPPAAPAPDGLRTTISRGAGTTSTPLQKR
jgi:hypothetical protein